MTYEQKINSIRIIQRGVQRIKTIENRYQSIVFEQVAIALRKMNKAELKAFDRKKTKQLAKDAQYLLNHGFIAGGNAIEMLSKTMKRRVKHESSVNKIHKSFAVRSGDGFKIDTLSISKNGIMVSVQHKALKTNVTRHLKRSGNQYTGRAPFGIETFITYHVNEIQQEELLAA